LTTATITQRSACRFELPAWRGPSRVLRFRVRGGGGCVADDGRLLAFRVFRCQWESSPGPQPPAAGPVKATIRAAVTPLALRKRLWLQWRRLQRLIARIAESPDGTISIQVPTGFQKVAAAYVGCGGVTGAIRKGFRRYAPPAAARIGPHPSLLHTNGCGDFTLMSREDWFDLRGYPQFDLFAMHIDSVLCHAAHYGGIQETVVQDPIRIYHIEHAAGSGWTPEGQAKLYERLDAEEIPYLDSLEVVRWGEQMRRLCCPMVFNHDNWGLADYALEESTIGPPPAATAV